MSFQDPLALTSNGRTFTKWTKRDLSTLRKHHANWPDDTLAWTIGKTLKSVRTMACRLGLKKSKARLSKMGRENIEKRHQKARRKA